MVPAPTKYSKKFQQLTSPRKHGGNRCVPTHGTLCLQGPVSAILHTKFDCFRSGPQARFTLPCALVFDIVAQCKVYLTYSHFSADLANIKIRIICVQFASIIVPSWLDYLHR